MKIENLKTCTGCHACYSVCPKFAIKMIANSEGFLYPDINHENCINCGKCESVCEVLNLEKREEKNTIAYAALNLNEEIRFNSSSGGIFSAIAEKVILEDGVVFGAGFDKDFSVIHKCTETKEGLADFRGSKYLQSAIGESYKLCKQYLVLNRKVLFSGTPCQISGLKKFLGKEYKNLITVDFICHGVPSPLLWRKYIKFKENEYKSCLKYASFRYKLNGWKNYDIILKFDNGSVYQNKQVNDVYMRLFLKNVALRNSCYSCVCKSIQRFSDITLGDFWGIQNVDSEMDDDKGTSFLTVHTEKGNDLLKSCSELKVKSVSIKDGIKQNPCMIVSVNRPKQRETFFKDLCSKPFLKIEKKYANDSIIQKLNGFIKRFLRKLKQMLYR